MLELVVFHSRLGRGDFSDMAVPFILLNSSLGEINIGGSRPAACHVIRYLQPIFYFPNNRKRTKQKFMYLRGFEMKNFEF